MRTTWQPYGHYAWLIGPAKDHYHCFAVFNPKTKSTTIANQFHWAESNRFTAPKITPEEQITNAANDLAKAIKSKTSVLLPDINLQAKVEELCTIFQRAVEGLAINKPSPVEEETNETLDNYRQEQGDKQQQNPSKIVKEIQQHPRVDKETQQHPRVNKPISIPHRYPTRLKVATAAKTIQLEQRQMEADEPITTHIPFQEMITPPQLS